MIKIFKYLNKKEWTMIVFSLGLVVCQVWLDLKLPDFMNEITTLVETKGSQMSEIITQGGYMLLCAIGSLMTSFIVGYISAKVAAEFSMRIREMIYDKTVSFSMEELSKFSTASLITRSTNDITQIQTLIAMGLQAVVKAPILAVWAVAKIAGKNFTFTIATGCAVVFLLVIVFFMLFFSIPKSKKVQVLTDDLNRIVREHLTGIRVVRAYNAEEYQGKKFEKANTEVTNANTLVNRLTALMSPTMTFIMSMLTLSIYWLGAGLINHSAMSGKLPLFSDMVVFSSYAMQVIMAFMMLTMAFIMLPRASVAAKRIMEVLNTPVTIIDGTVTDSSADGRIEFKNVSFGYPDAEENVLNHITFTAEQGETVAVIGATGSGKSTLINLIPRFYDTTEGEVLVDGIDVRDYVQSALRNKIGYISQKAVMFSGTVSSNVSFGDNGSDRGGDVERSIETAQAMDFVKETGIDGHVSQGGSNLSGGQKQRLSIARAICRDPEILIFDDSFSALDYATDRALRDALSERAAKATKVIVAQRISTIRDADMILVLEDGAVVGQGTHDELMKTSNVYKEIALSQLSKEELENE